MQNVALDTIVSAEVANKSPELCEPRGPPTPPSDPYHIPDLANFSFCKTHFCCVRSVTKNAY
jgi:hypothetical protein